MIGGFAGSFDPITEGHLNIIRKAAPFFDILYIIVAHNQDKNYTFDLKERVELIDEAVIECNIPHNVKVRYCNNLELVVDRARSLNVTHLVRGIRDADDALAELKLADINKSIGSIETVFFHTDNCQRFISSSLVKEMVKCKRSVSDFVPRHVYLALREKYLCSSLG